MTARDAKRIAYEVMAIEIGQVLGSEYYISRYPEKDWPKVVKAFNELRSELESRADKLKRESA